MAVVAAVVAFVLVVGGAVAWWVTRDEGGPFAGRPRVNDEKAGLSYAIPEGWQRNEDKLLDAFTSAVTRKGPEETDDTDGADDPEGGGATGATVLAGRSGAVPHAELRRQTERAASSNAEFFCPDGRRTLHESEATTVSDRPAHTVVLTVAHRACGTLHLRMTVISVDDNRSAFLIGLAYGHVRETGREQGRRLADAVIKDASVTGP